MFDQINAALDSIIQKRSLKKHLPTRN